MANERKPPRRRLGKGLSAILDTQTAKTSNQNANKTGKSSPGVVEVRIPGERSGGGGAGDSRVSELAAAAPKAGDVAVDIPEAGPGGAVGGTASGAEPESRPVEERGEVGGLAGVRRIALDEIRAGEHQPRTHFDEEALASLAASIRSVGVIQPITVRPATGGGFELIAGERRWRASKLAGLADIPAIITHADEQAAAETALIENLQREDLNPIEKADAIRGLIDRFAFSQSMVAERVGLDRSSVSNLLRLADLEEPIRDLLASGLLGLGHGKALLSMMPGRSRIETAAKASREGWSVRRIEEESRKQRASDPSSGLPSGSSSGVGASGVGAASGDGDVETRALEKRLSEHLGTKVNLRVDRSGKGVVQIRFFDLDHFDDLMSRIGFDAGGIA